MLTSDDAVTAALQFRDDPGFKWTEPPTAPLVEEMTYEQANTKIGLPVDEGRYQALPRETMVWLVIFEGRWTLKPMGPQDAAPLPYEGCLLHVILARDGSLLAAGDSVCPR